MAVPKKRMSRARRDRRRAHHDKIIPPNYVICSNPACGMPVLPHRACPHCGFYKGIQVIEIKEKVREEVGESEAG